MRTIIDALKIKGSKVGLALNPPTPVEAIFPYLDELDMITVMAVMPGLGGQAFMPDVLPKGQCFYVLASGRAPSTWPSMVASTPKQASKQSRAGANILIAGTYVCAADDYKRLSYHVATLNSRSLLMRILLMLASLSLLGTQNNASAKLVRVGGEFRVKSIQKTKDRGFVITFASTDSKAQVQEITLESTYLHVSVEEGKALRLSAEVTAQQGRVVTARQILLFLPTAGFVSSCLAAVSFRPCAV